MNIAIRYFSKTGNTSKLAATISSKLQVPAESIDVPIPEPIDILFLGGGIYAGKVSSEILYFISKLTPSTIKKVVIFSSSAGNKNVYSLVEPLLTKKGIVVDRQYFHCKGKFLLAFRSRPNQEDQDNLIAFVEEAVKKEGVR